MRTRKATQTTFGVVFGDLRIEPLSDRVFFQEGPGLRNWQWSDTGMRVINGKNILVDGTIDLSNTERCISMEEFHSKYSHFAVEEGDIVVTSSGTIGKVGRIKREQLPIMMNTSVIRFHPLPGAELDADFLFSFLRSNLFQQQAVNFAIGAAQPNFGPAHLKQMKIVLPPLPTQRKIAAILSAYDDLIENNLRRIAILEEMAQNLYREWFVRFRFPGHQGARFTDSPIGSIPEGWGVTPLRHSLALCRKSVQPWTAPDESFEHFSFPAYDSGRLPAIQQGRDIKSVKYQVPSNCILVPKLNPHIARVWLPSPSNQCRPIASSEYLVLMPRQYSTAFWYVLFSSPGMAARLAGRADGTSTSHKRIKPGDFLDQPAVEPPVPVVEAFESLVVPAMNLATSLLYRNLNLRSTRDLLLPKLISGEVDVSELDIAGAADAQT